MENVEQKRIIELCCNYLKDKDTKVVKYLQKKFKIAKLEENQPKLEQIVSKHFKKIQNSIIKMVLNPIMEK